ncbi:CaiB/BaiF CoA transferase family protein [Chloroflexota bacterium]
MEIRPFEGLHFLDFTWAGVGPFTGNFLGYYGATTIRVESASRPDPVRFPRGVSRKQNPGLESGPVFAISNPVKKLGFSLNLKHPKALDIFKSLVSWADVIVENFTTSAIERMGLGYEELKKIKPNIILYRTNGYGHTGPMANQPGFGQTVTAITGMHGIAGWPDRPPVPVSTFYTDHLAPLFGAFILIAAINHLRKTGEGQCIAHSQVEAGINYLTPVILDYTVNGRDLALTGNKCAHSAPHGAYRCKGDDRWVAVGVQTDEEWNSFCRVIGNPGWTDDTRFYTLSGRVEHSDELDRLINEWTVNFTAEQVMAMMQAAGVSAGVVSNAQDSELDPQLKHYDFFRELEHPYLGKRNFYHPPGFKLSEAVAEVARPTLLGEYTEYICTEILDMTQGDFARMKQEGVFD